MSNKFEKDSLEVLKKWEIETQAWVDRQSKQYNDWVKRDSIRLINPLTTRGSIEVYNSEHTDSRMSLSYLSRYEGATDDNHRFKFTEK